MKLQTKNPPNVFSVKRVLSCQGIIISAPYMLYKRAVSWVTISRLPYLLAYNGRALDGQKPNPYKSGNG